jgi:hypothetical protein
MSALRLSRQGARNRPPATRNRSRALPACATTAPHRSRDPVLSHRRYGPHSPADEPSHHQTRCPREGGDLGVLTEPYSKPPEAPACAGEQGASLPALLQAAAPQDLPNAVNLVAAGWADPALPLKRSQTRSRAWRPCYWSARALAPRRNRLTRRQQATRYKANKKGSGFHRSLLSSAKLGQDLMQDPFRRWRSSRCRRSRTS